MVRIDRKTPLLFAARTAPAVFSPIESVTPVGAIVASARF